MKLIEKLEKTKLENINLEEKLTLKIGKLEVKVGTDMLNSNLELRISDGIGYSVFIPLKDWEELINKEE
jgi:hypothetical protein